MHQNNKSDPSSPSSLEPCPLNADLVSSPNYRTSYCNSDTINILDYLEVIVKHKRMIIRTTLAAFAISIVYSLMLPKIYSSTAMIIPPQQEQGIMGMMMGQMGGGMASLAGDLLGKGSPADMYVSILNSNAISDTIIDRFKLMEIYDQKFRMDTYKALDEKVNIAAGKKDGIISITVVDRDPKLATDMANAYVDELGKLTVKLNMTGAGQNKAFLEERLAKAKVDLAKAEDALKFFQSRNKTLDIAEQAKGAIKGVAEIEGQLAAEEVKLAGLRRVFTESSQEVKNQQVVVANLRGQISKFEGMGSGGAIPGVGSVPELGQQYLRLMREFKIQETLVEILTKQYEMAKLSEAKDVTSIQVLQKARVPDKKAKPKRSMIVLASTFAGWFMAVLYAFIHEASAKMSLDDRERWRAIRNTLLLRLPSQKQ